MRLQRQQQQLQYWDLMDFLVQRAIECGLVNEAAVTVDVQTKNHVRSKPPDPNAV